MGECGCVITHTTNGVSVKLCGAHSYGTEMLPVLRRFMQIFSELEERYGQKLTEAYTDTLQEARAILRKVDDSQEGQRGDTDGHPLADTQNVMDFPTRRTTDLRLKSGRTEKLA